MSRRNTSLVHQSYIIIYVHHIYICVLLFWFLPRLILLLSLIVVVLLMLEPSASMLNFDTTWLNLKLDQAFRCFWDILGIRGCTQICFKYFEKSHQRFYQTQTYFIYVKPKSKIPFKIQEPHNIGAYCYCWYIRMWAICYYKSNLQPKESTQSLHLYVT